MNQRHPSSRWPAVLAAWRWSPWPPRPSSAPPRARRSPPRRRRGSASLAAKGEAVIVDVRSKDAYDLEHAEGAVSIPLTELEARLAELPKDK